MFRIAAAVAALLCLSSFAFAQGGNSQLGGVVTDPSGALIPGVTITVTNVDTGVTNTAISNESGAYNFPSLQPGPNYRVSAQLPGFQARTVTNLPIGSAVNVRQDFQLQLSSQVTTVEVSIAANELLTTNTQSVGEVLTAERAQNLPIVGNEVLSLITLMPGVRGDQDNPVFAGVSEERINTVRDGLSVSDGRFQSGVFSTTFINPDLIGEVRIILTPVDAEMGRGNGQVIISTRSGTNRFSGAAQWDIRNSGLNPNTWGNNNDVVDGQWTPTQPNWFNTHHYTVSFGGPIIRNKTFFFALWDQQLQYQRNVVTASVMTPQARNGIFRFYPGWTNGNANQNLNVTSTTNNGGNGTGTIAVVDDIGNPMRPATYPNSNRPYDQQLTCISVFGTTKADGTPVTPADCPGGNLITGTWDSRRPVMDPTAYIARVMGKMPAANYFGTGDGLNTAGYRFLRTRRGNSGAGVTIGTDTNTDRQQINLKIDHNFTANHKLAGSWSYERNDTYGDLPNWPDGIPYYTQRYPQVFTANLTSTLSPTLLNEARFGIRYSNANVAAPHEREFYPDQGALEEALNWTLPVAGYDVTLDPGAGNFNFGGTPNGIFDATPGQYNGNVSSLYDYADTLSWTRGKHAFKFGAEYRHTVSNGYNNIGSGGGVRIPFVRVTGGSNTENTSELNTAGSNANGTNGGTLLPATVLTGNRTNAVNMLYFLAGSVNEVQQLYWIDNADDVTNGTWESVATQGRKFRDTVQNELSFFVKDDWKVSRDLTLNLGLRWDYYASPYIGSGFTSTTVDTGAGLFGVSRQGLSGMFDNWMHPGNVYLSGYGSFPGVANPANALQCTTGVSNGPNLPASNCDPSLMTAIEFIGPKTPNPDKLAYPNDWNNFGPAVGFSWNTNIFGERRATTVRGGYQITYGGSGRTVGGGGTTATETVIGSAPGSTLNANTVPLDFGNEYFDLTDVPKLVPVTPIIPPGDKIPIYRTANFSSVDPNFVTPYTQNFNLSVTTQVSQKVTLDLRYIGTVSKKQQSSVNLNTNNVFYNKELFEALEITRAGGNAPLFDEMFAGLNFNSGVDGYGAIGTCVAFTGSAANFPGAGQEGCGPNQVRNHGSAHLRRTGITHIAVNGTAVRQLIANGNYLDVGTFLMGNGGTVTGLQNSPAISPSVDNRRLLRNGCDRLANNVTSIATRCFPENYMVINPQLGTPTFITNGNSSNYHSMQAQVTLRPTHGLSMQGTYTWSKNLGISGNASDPLNRNADYTLTNNHIEHDFRMNGTFELPLGPNKLFFGNTSGWVARVLERWQTGVIMNWQSGSPESFGGEDVFYDNSVADIVSPFPFKKGHVQWNGDNNAAGNLHGGTYFGNPNPFIGVDDPQCAEISVVDSMGYNLGAGTALGSTAINNNCTINALAHRNADGTPGQIIFQTPRPGKRGTAGRNTFFQRGEWDFDANISKTFRLTESKSLQIRIDTTNVFNHPEPADVEFDTTDGNFGLIPGQDGNTPGKSGTRSFQGSVRFTF